MWPETVLRYSLIALVAGLIAFVATPLTLMAARRLRLIDKPGPHKFHIVPVPILGGLSGSYDSISISSAMTSSGFAYQ